MNVTSTQNIIIYGDRHDNEIAVTLMRILAQSKTVNYFSHFDSPHGVIKTFGQGLQSFNLFEVENLSEIKLIPCILIAKKDAIMEALRFLDGNTTVIINAANSHSIARLSAYCNNIFTCGFSAKDYATFSSREEENVVVSIQRSMHIGHGELCEPFEIPCHVDHPLQDYTILACVLALILAGELDENKCKNLGKICFSY